MQIRLQASIMGYTGKPATVYAMYDQESGHCIIGKIGKGKATLESGSVLIVDNTKTNADDYYLEDSITQSIHDFFTLKAETRLNIRDNVRIADPSGAIEFDGVKSGKKDYRILPSISNAQVATLAVCRYIQKSTVIEDSIDFMDELMALSSGSVVTI